mmetsp:Transcript_109400/g.310246  ORF Transcript_109400/g.310246 Transcript_109400/m.310246 type:complete len:208 (-) Transcript_109400:214-837(-)
MPELRLCIRQSREPRGRRAHLRRVRRRQLGPVRRGGSGGELELEPGPGLAPRAVPQQPNHARERAGRVQARRAGGRRARGVPSAHQEGAAPPPAAHPLRSRWAQREFQPAASRAVQRARQHRPGEGRRPGQPARWSEAHDHRGLPGSSWPGGRQGGHAAARGVQRGLHPSVGGVLRGRQAVRVRRPRRRPATVRLHARTGAVAGSAG